MTRTLVTASNIRDVAQVAGGFYRHCESCSGRDVQAHLHTLGIPEDVGVVGYDEMQPPLLVDLVLCVA